MCAQAKTVQAVTDHWYKEPVQNSCINWKVIFGIILWQLHQQIPATFPRAGKKGKINCEMAI